jgi:Zn-dependent peptidase ImmA (M78 family)
VREQQQQQQQVEGAGAGTDLPKTVRIAGLTFTIEEKETPDLIKSGAYGQTSVRDQRIYLNPGMAQQIKRSTLVHEMLHVLLFTAGCGLSFDEEERIVGIAEANVYRWLKENDFSWVKEGGS